MKQKAEELEMLGCGNINGIFNIFGNEKRLAMAKDLEAKGLLIEYGYNKGLWSFQVTEAGKAYRSDILNPACW